MLIEYIANLLALIISAGHKIKTKFAALLER